MVANSEDDPSTQAAEPSSAKPIWWLLFVLIAIGVTLLVTQLISAPSSISAPFPPHPYAQF